mmetsp:Transcript_38378/g.123078  ORF Transcript_38378/g.123078 Transcript_38378/m.123078 type:complete len:198 (-) Transcript_38378:351-944(-)
MMMFDSKAIEVAVAELRRVSDALLLAGAERDLAKKVDTACALIELNDAASARAALDDAIRGCPPGPASLETYGVLRDVRSRLPERAREVNSDVTASLAVREDFPFEQSPGDTEAYVHLPLPGGAAKEDVFVDLQPTTIRVQVRDRRLVDDRRLFAEIDAKASSWFLESSSSGGTLTIHLEKRKADTWPSLFALSSRK